MALMLGSLNVRTMLMRNCVYLVGIEPRFTENRELELSYGFDLGLIE